MLIPRYWARGESRGTDGSGKPVRVVVWGWSATSLDEARIAANERARRAVERLARRNAAASSRDADYDSYLQTPLREEVVETLRLDEGETAVVTRNRYGALVLNSGRVLFVDVDYPTPARRRLFDRLRIAFSRVEPEPQREAHADVVGRIVDWAAANPDHSFRLYRTRAGLRLLFTGKLFDPTGDEVRRIFEELGTDRLYQRLTLKQKSFRARLTPKPWRVGIAKPTIKYPYASDYARAAMDDWLTLYDDVSLKFQVCAFLDSFGREEEQPPEVRQIVAFHDRATCRGTSLPLA